MKSYFWQFILFICSSLFLTSCLKEHDDLVPDLEGVPAGGMTNVELLRVEGDEVELEVTLFLVDHLGGFIDGLSKENFNLESTLSNVEARVTEIRSESDKERGPFSATLLFDQSGSINSTDPYDSRVEAGISFAEIVAGGDEASITAFTSGSAFQSPYEILNDFTGDPEVLKSSIQSLLGRAGGGTPLYISMYDMIEHTNNNAKNENQAVVAFTDGGDTRGGVSISEIIQKACQEDVEMFTVGLGSGVDIGVLSEVAFRTGGAVMLAEDALQLVALYNSLGALLHGEGEYYKASMTLKQKSGDWRPGQIVQGKLSIPLSESYVINLPFQKQLTRENAGSIEERVPECSCADKGTEDIIKKWKDEANKYLNRNQSNSVNNQPITCAYADVYEINSEKFKWAGLAAIVSGQVGNSESWIPDLRQVGIEIDFTFAKDLLNGNRAVFDDLLWQHLAYQNGGINEIEKIFCEGGISKSVLTAWIKINSDDENLIWDGNRDLLYHEQQNILQAIIYQEKYDNIWITASVAEKINPFFDLLVSPVPNHEDEYPGLNIADFNSRWNWIETSILPEWRKYESNPNNATALQAVHKQYCPSCCGK